MKFAAAVFAVGAFAAGIVHADAGEDLLKKAGCTGATADVVNGKVTIKGTVPEAKYVECIQVVNQSGVTGIDNQLQKGK